MPHHIELRRLIRLAQKIEDEHPALEDNPWADSPFEWLKYQSPSTKGAVAEKLFEDWCKAKGATVSPPKTREYDRLVNGHRMEVKLSMVWKSGILKFQQIRNQPYDHVVCLALAPTDASCWVIPKRTAIEHSQDQHGGRKPRRRGPADTRWFQFDVDTPPRWMARYGGPLDDAWAVIERLGQGEH